MNKHLIKITCSLVFLLLLHATAKAQGVTVQGKVTDPDKKPVPGVTVAEVDVDGRTIKATKTDIEGNFSLKVNSTKHKLFFSHISHKTSEQNIEGRTTFNISLESSYGI